MDVVDRDQDRLLLRQPHDDRPHGGSQGPVANGFTVGIGAKERHVQRPPLRDCQRLERRRGHCFHEVGDGRERHLRLGLRRATGEDQHTIRSRAADGRVEDGGLADPRRTFEQEDAEVIAGRGDDVPGPLELGVAADGDGHAGSLVSPDGAA